MINRRGIAGIVVVACGFLVVPLTARAAGFEYGPQGVHAVGRGGAFVVKADDPSAMYWNPAKLALLRGTRMLMNDNISFLSESFERAPQQKLSSGGVPTGDALTFDGVSNQNKVFPTGMSFALTTDFGLDDWGFALGMIGPSAFGKVGFPGDTTSANRYSFENLDVLMAFVTASAAWKYKEIVGVGASLQYGFIPYLDYGMTMIGPAGTAPKNPQNDLNDLRVDVSVKQNFLMNAILGVWYRPLPCLELAASARIVPMEIRAKGDASIQGTANSTYGTKKTTTVPIRLDFTFPTLLNAGLRYVHMAGEKEVFDIEADFAWEHWSALDAFRMNFLQDNLDVFGASVPLKQVVLARNYKDTYKVSVGGDYNVLPDYLTLRAGTWYESSGQPNAYTMLDFPSWDRVGLGAGISGKIRGVEMAVSYAHIFMISRDVAAGEGRIYQMKMQPDGTIVNGLAVNEGHFSGSYDVLTVGLTLHWDALIHGPTYPDREPPMVAPPAEPSDGVRMPDADPVPAPAA